MNISSSIDTVHVGELTRNIFVQISTMKSRIFGLMVLAVLLCSSFQLAYADGSNPKGKPFVALNGEIVAVQGAISSLEEQVEILVGRVDSIEQRLTADENAILTLQDQNQALQALVGQNLTDIAAIQNEISVLQAQNVYLQSLIASGSGSTTLQSEIDANSALIASLQNAILLANNNIIVLGTSLQAQIDNNLSLINMIRAEIDQINASLLLKQNLVSGICPDGSAVQQVMPDGTVVCGAAGGGSGGTTGTFVSVRAYSLGTAVQNGAVNLTATCPTGFFATGFGYAYALGWNVGNIGVNDASVTFFYAINRNSYPADIFYIVSCAGFVQ